MKSSWFIAAVLLTIATPGLPAAVVRITKSAGVGSNSIDVRADRVRLSEVLRALELHLGRAIIVETSSDPKVAIRLEGVTPMAALHRISAVAKVKLIERRGRFIITDLAEPRASLDVVDEDVRVILRSLQKQCAIKNLLLDKDVAGKGTFLLTDVPCSIAFRTVFQSLGLDSDSEPGSVVHVAPRKNR